MGQMWPRFGYASPFPEVEQGVNSRLDMPVSRRMNGWRSVHRRLNPQYKNLRGWLVAVGLALSAPAVGQGADLYVAPNGTPAGPGTATKPYDFLTAISGSVGRAGDTFWLRDGTYNVGHATTQIHGEEDKPITFCSFSNEHARVIGSLTLWGAAGHVVFRDFELTSGVGKRVSAQMRAGFKPSDLTNFFEGIQVYSPNCSFVNLVVHDSVRSGFYTAQEATNTLIYGCIVYSAGWASPDNAEGHSYYLQGAGEIAENLAMNSTGAGFHVYANGKGTCLRDLILEGNIAFGAGAIQSVRPYRDWIVGVDAPAVNADNICLRSNMGYVISGSSTLTQVQLGREQPNGRLLLTGNYWPQGMVVKNWRSVTSTNNLLAPQYSDSALRLEQASDWLLAAWDRNAYSSKNRHGFRVNADSRTPAGLSGTATFVRPNRYQHGRANIVIYNWDRLDKVPVDLRGVLSSGDSYEVRNAADFFAPPVAKGVFDGRQVELPMEGLTVARPMGGLKPPPPTGRTFNAFVLLPGKTH
jgi:hypothetical protein